MGTSEDCLPFLKTRSLGGYRHFSGDGDALGNYLDGVLKVLGAGSVVASTSSAFCIVVYSVCIIDFIDCANSPLVVHAILNWRRRRWCGARSSSDCSCVVSVTVRDEASSARVTLQSRSSPPLGNIGTLWHATRHHHQLTNYYHFF